MPTRIKLADHNAGCCLVMPHERMIEPQEAAARNTVRTLCLTLDESQTMDRSAPL